MMSSTSAQSSVALEDAEAPVVQQTVEEPAGARRQVAKDGHPAALTKEPGQRRLVHKIVLLDSEDAEEYTEHAGRRLSIKGTSLISESEDAEESRVEVPRTLNAIDESAEEYSYIGGGERSETRTRVTPRAAKDENKDVTPREDFPSEEVSVSESLWEQSKSYRQTQPRSKYGKDFEESTDAESASESELPFRDEETTKQKV